MEQERWRGMQPLKEHRTLGDQLSKTTSYMNKGIEGLCSRAAEQQSSRAAEQQSSRAAEQQSSRAAEQQSLPRPAAALIALSCFVTGQAVASHLGDNIQEHCRLLPGNTDGGMIWLVGEAYRSSQIRQVWLVQWIR
jgi:hypothetical protein